MKAIHALLLLMFIYIANADIEGFKEKYCSDFMPGTNNPAFSLDFCRSTNIGDATRCCFVKLEDKSENEKRLYHCYPINNEQWADIEKLETTLERNYTVVSIECGASYLYASLLILIALLF